MSKTSKWWSHTATEGVFPPRAMNRELLFLPRQYPLIQSHRCFSFFTFPQSNLTANFSIFVQEPSVRSSPAQQHRRHDSTPSTFGDLSLLHTSGERLTSPPQPIHARRHSAAGALTGLLNDSPAAQQRLRRQANREDGDAVRSSRTQVYTLTTVLHRSLKRLSRKSYMK